MDVRPDFARFTRLARSARVVPVWREFLFDVDTPVGAYYKVARPPFSFLLESVVGGDQWARYSFVGSNPYAAWRLSASGAEWWTASEGWRPIEAEDPVADLDRRLRTLEPAHVPELPRFWGGAVGYFGYDLVRRIERLPQAPPDDLGLPEAVVMFADQVLVIDNLLGTGRAVASVRLEGDETEAELRTLYHEGMDRADRMVHRLRTGPTPPALEPAAEGQDPPFTSSMEREAFETGVRRIQEYIAAGDAFQVVLSQRLGVDVTGSPFDLYRVLRSLNPSPYLFLLELDGLHLVGASPEVLVRLEGGRVTVRPIAGTRPRGSSAEEDRRLAEELRADEKELAEHRMLVDLGRNDVGRVARYGTVEVPDLMEVERYSHVMHLCSQVEGDVLPDLSALDVLQACFPAGTVSGAPKVRAMEIIDEIEPVRRGPYAGAVGHVGFGGRTMDTAIAIRTVVHTGARAYIQAGAGVVADSVPASEYDETLNKARALLRAVAMLEGSARPDQDPPDPSSPASSTAASSS